MCYDEIGKCAQNTYNIPCSVVPLFFFFFLHFNTNFDTDIDIYVMHLLCAIPNHANPIDERFPNESEWINNVIKTHTELL